MGQKLRLDQNSTKIKWHKLFPFWWKSHKFPWETTRCAIAAANEAFCINLQLSEIPNSFCNYCSLKEEKPSHMMRDMSLVWQCFVSSIWQNIARLRKMRSGLPSGNSIWLGWCIKFTLFLDFLLPPALINTVKSRTHTLVIINLIALVRGTDTTQRESCQYLHIYFI